MIADAAMEIEAARFMVYRAAWMKGPGAEFHRNGGDGEAQGQRSRREVAHDAIQIHGSYGYSASTPSSALPRPSA